MTLGKRIILLQKKKGLSQADLDKTVESSCDIIGRCETKEVKPPVEVVIKNADTLKVSVEVNLHWNATKTLLKGNRIFKKLNTEDKTDVFARRDAFSQSHKVKKVFAGEQPILPL